MTGGGHEMNLTCREEEVQHRRKKATAAERDGVVESARLLSPRRHVLGGMFLSAVKAWEFHPATRDGVPVRFRKTILVSFE